MLKEEERIKGGIGDERVTVDEGKERMKEWFSGNSTEGGGK